MTNVQTTSQAAYSYAVAMSGPAREATRSDSRMTRMLAQRETIVATLHAFMADGLTGNDACVRDYYRALQDVNDRLADAGFIPTHTA